MLSLESNLLTDEWFCYVYFSIITLDEALLVFDWDLVGVRVSNLLNILNKRRLTPKEEFKLNNIDE